MNETNLLKLAKRHEKLKKSGALEVESLLNSVGWTDTIEPEFEKIITHYYKLLTEATLSSEDIVCLDPLTGVEGKVSPDKLAARIEGLRFALDLLKSKLKEANKSRVNVGG